MATLEIMWPSYLKPIKVLRQSGDWGVTTANYNTGVEIRRSFQDRNLKSYNFSVYLDPDNTDEYHESLGFLNYICGGLNSFWFGFPHYGSQFDMIVGVGDGSRTTWAIPALLTTGTPSFTVDNIPPINSGNLRTDGPNLLSENEASAYSDAYTFIIGDSKSSESGLSTSFPSVITDPMRIISFGEETLFRSANDTVVAGNGHTFTVHAIMSSDQNYYHSGKVEVGFYKSDGTLLTSSGAYLELMESGKRYIISKTFTAAHADTAYVAIHVGVTDDGDGYAYVHACSLVHDDLPELWYPQTSRKVMTLDSAPADGTIVKVRILSGTPILYMVADSVSGNLNAIGAREVKVKIRELVHG